MNKQAVVETRWSFGFKMCFNSEVDGLELGQSSTLPVMFWSACRAMETQPSLGKQTPQPSQKQVSFRPPPMRVRRPPSKHRLPFSSAQGLPLGFSAFLGSWKTSSSTTRRGLHQCLLSICEWFGPTLNRTLWVPIKDPLPWKGCFFWCWRTFTRT